MKECNKDCKCCKEIKELKKEIENINYYINQSEIFNKELLKYLSLTKEEQEYIKVKLRFLGISVGIK